MITQVEQALVSSWEDSISAQNLTSDDMARLRDAHERMLTALGSPSTVQARAVLLQQIERIDVREAAIVGGRTIEISVTAVRRGARTKIVVPPVCDADSPTPSSPLCKLVAQAFTAQQMLYDNGSLDAVKEQMQVGREYAADLIRTSYLRPSIIEAMVQSRQPKHLTRQQLVTSNRIIPLGWEQQRQMFGFG